MNKLKLTLASFAVGVALMAAPITAFAACSRGFTISDWDSGSTWDCYYVGEDTDYCYYECWER